MAKEWASKLLFGLILYYVVFILFTTSAPSVIDYFEFQFNGSIEKNVTLNSTFGSQSTCDYPRYKYNTRGEATRYWFDLDNLDCDVSAGAISKSVCNKLEGCLWDNVTTGFLWFTETSERCTGELNKTFYNGGVATQNNICEIGGLQGDSKINTCTAVGCTSYAPENDATGGIKSPLTILDTVGDLFTFRYDFGIEGENKDLWQFIVTFLFVYIPLIALFFAIYIMSPFSN